MGKRNFALMLAAIAAVSLLSACAEPVPPQEASYGYYPGYERGIDQDISATHDGGSATLDNVGPGSRTLRQLDRQ